MPPSKPARHRIERQKARARYERGEVHAILDAGMVAHVGFCVGSQPYVVPMLYARDGDALWLHGSVASRLLRELGGGIEACVSVTLVDALVLARSHFNHSMNYRSVVAFGRAVVVEDAGEKAGALARFVDALIPGRAAESRAADASELAATTLLRLQISDASAKVRDGGVKDAQSDLGLPHWAGLVPLRGGYAAPVPAADLPAHAGLPASVHALLADEAIHT